MAISAGPRGLVPLRHLTGGLVRLTQYPITNASNNQNTAIFNGDLVAFANTGLVALNNGLAQKSVGVLVGASFTDPTTPLGGRRFMQYWPGSAGTNNPTDAVAYVVDDPWVVFLIASDSTNNVAATAAGLNATINTGTAGSTITGNSGVVLDGSSPATTATLPLRIIKNYQVPNNNYGAPSLLLEVMFNPAQHYYTQGTAV